MKVTYKSLKDFAFAHYAQGHVEQALGSLVAAYHADPLDLEIRFLTVDILTHLQVLEPLEKVLVYSAEIAMRSGHPIAAMAFLHLIEKLGKDADPLWKRLAYLYSANSTQLSQSGSKVAPLPDETPVDGPAETMPPLPELVAQVTALAQTITRSEDFPATLLPMPLLSDVPAHHFVEVARVLHLVSMTPGQALIREGEPGNSFFMIGTGAFSVFKTDALGRVTPLATLHAGSIVGEMALVQRAPRSASVTAQTWARVLEFPAEAIARLAEHLEQVAIALDKFTRERLIGNLLATSPLFKPFSRTQRMDLLKHFQAYVVETDTVIVRQGEEGTGLYLILGGEVEVMRDLDTPQSVSLATLSAPENFGEISLLLGSETTASVVATRRTTLLFLSRHYFLRLMQSVPEMRDYFSQLADSRLSQTQETLAAQTAIHDEEEIILI
ncbi:cyclic nucleotide-binding domain-containing protein [Myxococcota bacterium]|nr:cyclic nucleotide-binding domain-containing protein [Myxococcota bacterium]